MNTQKKIIFFCGYANGNRNGNGNGNGMSYNMNTFPNVKLIKLDDIQNNFYKQNEIYFYQNVFLQFSDLTIFYLGQSRSLDIMTLMFFYMSTNKPIVMIIETIKPPLYPESRNQINTLRRQIMYYVKHHYPHIRIFKSIHKFLKSKKYITNINFHVETPKYTRILYHEIKPILFSKNPILHRYITIINDTNITDTSYSLSIEASMKVSYYYGLWCHFLLYEQKNKNKISRLGNYYKKLHSCNCIYDIDDSFFLNPSIKQINNSRGKNVIVEFTIHILLNVFFEVSNINYNQTKSVVYYLTYIINNPDARRKMSEFTVIPITSDMSPSKLISIFAQKYGLEFIHDMNKTRIYLRQLLDLGETIQSLHQPKLKLKRLIEYFGVDLQNNTFEDIFNF